MPSSTALAAAAPALLMYLAIGYLLGSLPFAVLVSRAFGLADPRSYGSGNPGATNVLRSGNKKAALFTLLGDALKGVAAVVLARSLHAPEAVVALTGLAAFVGHLFPLFLKFKGGKGVATAAGVLLALDPLVGLVTLATWIGVAAISRYSSMAALIAALTAPLAVGLSGGEGSRLLVVGLMALGLIAKHWANIQRLLAGQEPKIGAKKKAA
ncbi:glycerol-3-phosphate acyltransferase PlsY [Oryzomicrobium terrae]|uniref:Glycerol-3-phosphate acyltransferase n=1 Tax=Oryzomicrobium terrae TaxID=1735038 RepID=A0A5C1EB50_9RHOO|nr:glycerol-3-phosphate acyltransferase PlsY [Oryzomicrobium terrae]